MQVFLCHIKLCSFLASNTFYLVHLLIFIFWFLWWHAELHRSKHLLCFVHSCLWCSRQHLAEKVFRECLLNECMIDSSRKTYIECLLSARHWAELLYVLLHSVQQLNFFKEFWLPPHYRWYNGGLEWPVPQVTTLFPPQPIWLKSLFARHRRSGRVSHMYITLKDKEDVLTKSQFKKGNSLPFSESQYDGDEFSSVSDAGHCWRRGGRQVICTCSWTSSQSMRPCLALVTSRKQGFLSFVFAEFSRCIIKETISWETGDLGGEPSSPLACLNSALGVPVITSVCFMGWIKKWHLIKPSPIRPLPFALLAHLLWVSGFDVGPCSAGSGLCGVWAVASRRKALCLNWHGDWLTLSVTYLVKRRALGQAGSRQPEDAGCTFWDADFGDCNTQEQTECDM